MNFFLGFGTVKSGWSTLYIKGSQAIISKNIVFLSLKIDLVLANRADPDEIPQYGSSITVCKCTRLGFPFSKRFNFILTDCTINYCRIFLTLKLKGSGLC